MSWAVFEVGRFLYHTLQPAHKLWCDVPVDLAGIYVIIDFATVKMTEIHSLPENNPIPTLLAFLICESVIRDADTQKKTIVGVFDQLLSSGVPFPIAGLGLYAKLVEGRGSYSFKIRMVNLKDESPVLEIPIPANWPNPEAPLDFGVNLRGIPIQAFGDYEFQLYANDIYLGRAVFKIGKLQLPSSAPPTPRG